MRTANKSGLMAFQRGHLLARLRPPGPAGKASRGSSVVLTSASGEKSLN